MGDSKKVEIVEALPIKLAYEISKEDCSIELRDKVLNGEIKTLQEFMEAKKLQLTHTEDTQKVEEVKDYFSILENDFNEFNKNYRTLNTSLTDKLKDLPEDKQKSLAEELETINKKIEKLLRIL